jgi:hypothetical protein
MLRDESIAKLLSLHFQHAEPKIVLQELAGKNCRDETLAMRVVSEYSWADSRFQLLSILIGYLDQGIAAEEILELLAMRHALGGNLMHSIVYAPQPSLFEHWMVLLHRLLDAAHNKGKKSEMAEQIYHLLAAQSYYCNSNLQFKPIDAVRAHQQDTVKAYVYLVLRLARNGVNREEVGILLDKNSDSLWPEFWQQAAEQDDEELLKFIDTCFLSSADYNKFTGDKSRILEYVLQLTAIETKRNFLEKILDPSEPLGKLFSIKAEGEYRHLTKRRGLLQKADEALQSLPTPISALNKVGMFAFRFHYVEPLKTTNACVQSIM